jgi:hypothetical protein
MNKNTTLQGEANILCRYLTGKPAPAQCMELYEKAFRHLDLNLSDKEDRLWAKMMRHTWFIPYADGGLARLKPNSHIRKRIHTLFAIAETQPELADHFISPTVGPSGWLLFFFHGMKALFHQVAGVLLLRFIWRIK